MKSLFLAIFLLTAISRAEGPTFNQDEFSKHKPKPTPEVGVVLVPVFLLAFAAFAYFNRK